MAYISMWLITILQFSMIYKCITELGMFLSLPCLSENLRWVTSWQNQQNGMYDQRRLRSAWASTQSHQSLLCAQWVAKDTSFLHADSEDWSDWANAQADLSLRWSYMPFCWFCHEVAHLKFSDRQIWANSADPDQTACAVWSGSTLFAVFSASCSNFRVIKAGFSGV